MPDSPSLDWLVELETDKKGKFVSSCKNLQLIFEHDENLQGLFATNEFDRRRYLTKQPTWRKFDGSESLLLDSDYAEVRRYIGVTYGIYAPSMTDDAVTIECAHHVFHPVRRYLDGLQWDGVPRIESLLTRTLGAEQTEYTAAALRTTLIGAVKRIYEPACKFDTVLMLSGKQGIGKSTFFQVLAGSWFSDTFVGVRGKESFEQIWGRWIIEAPELVGMRQTEVEAVKAFFSKRVDQFRPAYGRVVEDYPRQCIFVGTTNENCFLNDPTGGRRYLPVKVGVVPIVADVWSDEFREIRDQVWAEAVALYRNGVACVMPAELESVADARREDRYETDPRAGIIEQFLDTKLPDSWEILNHDQYELTLKEEHEDGTLPNRVSIPYLWFVVLGLRAEQFNTASTKPLYAIMRRLSGWVESERPVTVPKFGRQKVFYRVDENGNPIIGIHEQSE